MKHLFVTRHGDYSSSSDRINDDGRKQMDVLGKAIKQILNGGSAYIMSSTRPRALDSSGVLAVQLALPEEFEHIPYLCSGADAPNDSYEWDSCRERLGKLMGLVDERRERADGIIMVTHLEVARDFPSYFLEKEFDEKKIIGEIRKGQSIHFDLEQKNYQILPK